MSAPLVHVVLGSTRQGRVGDRVPAGSWRPPAGATPRAYAAFDDSGRLRETSHDHGATALFDAVARALSRMQVPA